jgi:hypothetical protein
VLDLIESGFFSFGDPGRFRPILDSLRHHDPYLICADFDAYVAAEAQAAEAFRDPLDWQRRALFNIAGASRFSADETIRPVRRRDLGLEGGARGSGAGADRELTGPRRGASRREVGYRVPHGPP